MSYYLDKHRRVRHVGSGQLVADEAFKLIEAHAREAMQQIANAMDDDVNLLWAYENLRAIRTLAAEQIEEPA